MIYWREEGKTVKQGFNFYRPTDESSLGFYLRLGNRCWRIRYSKVTKKWFTGYNKIDPNALKVWETQHGYKHE